MSKNIGIVVTGVAVGFALVVAPALVAYYEGKKQGRIETLNKLKEDLLFELEHMDLIMKG